MKKTMYFLSALLVLLAVACNKNNSAEVPGLVPSKSSGIKKGEPVLFTLAKGDSGSAVSWSVNPASQCVVNPKGNKAVVTFKANGNYNVMASYNGVISNCSVTVFDTTSIEYKDSVIAIAPTETLNITVSKADTGLIFTAKTKNSYPCPYGMKADLAGTGDFKITYTGITLQTPCTGNTAPAPAYHVFFIAMSSNGTKPFSIVVNGTTYSGTVVRTGNSYSINWTNSNAVTLSPTTL